MRPIDIAIAGMGVGGLSVATFLARQGHRVVVYDQMERAGPVGSGFVLQPTGLAVIEALGLSKQLAHRGAAIHRLFGRTSPSRRMVLDAWYPAGQPALAVQRYALFDILFTAAAAAGVRFELNRRVTSISHGSRRLIEFADGSASPNFDLVIDCMGARSPMLHGNGRPLAYGALWATVPWRDDLEFSSTTLEQRYWRASQMAGVLPVGRATEDSAPKATFFWSMKTANYARWQALGIEAWKEDVHRLWPEASPLIESIAEPTHAVYRHHTDRHPVADGLARLGDAWHATSPQLGQGANMALMDAASLAMAMALHGDLPSALADYAHARTPHIRFYQALSVVLTPFYQSDSILLPIIRDYAIAPASRALPFVGKMITAMVSGSVLARR